MDEEFDLMQSVIIKHKALLELQQNRIVNSAMSELVSVLPDVKNVIQKAQKSLGASKGVETQILNYIDDAFDRIQKKVFNDTVELLRYENEFTSKVSSSVWKISRKKIKVDEIKKMTNQKVTVLNKSAKAMINKERTKVKGIARSLVKKSIFDTSSAGAIVNNLDARMSRTKANLEAVIKTNANEGINKVNDIVIEDYDDDVLFMSVAVLDDVTSKECQTANGKLYSKFEVKGELPRHPNCRCVMVPMQKQATLNKARFKDVAKDLGEEYKSEYDDKFEISTRRQMTLERQRTLEKEHL